VGGGARERGEQRVQDLPDAPGLDTLRLPHHISMDGRTAGTEQDDHNPQRIAPRNLFDLSVGHDNIFRGDRYKVSLRFTAINVANTVALYNYLSTFSGTHYVTPRTLTAELGFHF